MKLFRAFPAALLGLVAALAILIATPAEAAGTTATLNWTNPATYNDCATPPTGCTPLASTDIAGYVVSWSKTAGGPVAGSITLSAGIATTDQVPVACGTVFFTVQVKTTASAVYPNTTSDPTNPVSYASGVTCKPNPVTGLTAT